MTATREDVNGWIKFAKENEIPFIISVCDTFEYDDYPIYCKNIKELEESYFNVRASMQTINEVIKINSDGTIKENSIIQDILELKYE